jgi:hypothetical protein
MAATILNAPLVTTSDIISVLQRDIPKAWAIPIFDDFPSDSDVVRFGVYVSSVHTIERNPHQLGVQYCGTIYHAFDSFKIVYVSFQDDPHNVELNTIIANLVIAAKSNGQILFDGYFERTFDQELTYGTQAEKYIWTFRLLRLEFNT